jgi:transcriptional regulator with XRE-family HTH domain
MVIAPLVRHVAATMLAERVAENIARLRKARGWSLERVGVGCVPPTSYQQISRLEKGERTVDFEWVERIAPAFGLNPLELIVGEQIQTDKPDYIVFSLGEQVANEVARELARVALSGEEPDDGTVQVLALMLQELTATFAAHPQAYHDPKIALPVIGLAGRRYGPAKN